MDNIAGQLNFDISQFKLGAGEQSERYDSRFLLSALLVFVAKGDGGISNIESQKLLELLSSRFGIRNSEALDHLSKATMALTDDSDVTATLRKFSQRMSIEEKRDAFTMMLEIAAADGKQEAAEIDAIDEAAKIMDIPQDAIHDAYQAYFSHR
jgi:uncharacterized tellurite resistance protein B-like protein